ncbi:MAG: DUF72 domain-containing protein [Myxococcota bacterium]|nr:DUF72 domain-containing protein [Myxococcota bacterium]
MSLIASPPLYLGLPLWSHQRWSGTLYRNGSRAGDFLRQYAQVFQCVEGNTTFYATPSRETLTKWRAQTPASFRFMLKFPKRITHELNLEGAALHEARAFIEHLSPVWDRLGPILLQLPPRLSPRSLPALERFLAGLREGPRPELRFAVEARHWDFFDPARGGEALHLLLSRYEGERVIMDTRPLQSAESPYDAATREALERKPKRPVWPFALGAHPTVRFVSHPRVEANQRWLSQWAEQVVRWVREGRRPYFFVHHPGEDLAPEIAAYFYSMIQEQLGLNSLPPWPGHAQGELF